MNHRALVDIVSLPMILSEQHIVATIDEIIQLSRADLSLNPVEVAETLADIMSRQSSNYRPLADDVCRRIDDWLMEAWAEEPTDLFDALSVIVLMCGSQRGFDRMRTARASSNPDVQRIATATLEEGLRDGQISSI